MLFNENSLLDCGLALTVGIPLKEFADCCACAGATDLNALKRAIEETNILNSYPCVAHLL